MKGFPVLEVLSLFTSPNGVTSYQSLTFSNTDLSLKSRNSCYFETPDNIRLVEREMFNSWHGQQLPTGPEIAMHFSI
jgi:hypothetical protein